MSIIKTKLGDIQSSEQVEQLLLDHDFDELVENLTSKELVSIYNLYSEQEGLTRVVTMSISGPLTEQNIKQAIIENLMVTIF